MRYRVGVFIASLLLYAAGPVQAQTSSTERLSQQDRRVEETTRDALKPSESPAPSLPRGRARPSAPTAALPLYFLQTSQRYVTFHYDLAKAMVVLGGVDEDCINLESQVAYLTTQCILPRHLTAHFDPNAPLRKGMLALALCRALHIRGGLFQHLFPIAQRPALKELIYAGILSPGYPGDLVSGQEFVAAINSATEYLLRRRPRAKQPHAS